MQRNWAQDNWSSRPSVLISLSAACRGDRVEEISSVRLSWNVPLQGEILALPDNREPADPIHGGQSFGSLPSNIAQLTLSYAIFGDIHGYLWARADVPRMRGSKRLGGCEACASYPHFEICINNDST
jgi:hypothetical protein